MAKSKNIDANVLYLPQHIQEKGRSLVKTALTIVEAPMGYGKTTFVRECLKKVDADVIWQKVYDGNMTEFWRMFCHRLKKMMPEAAEDFMALGLPDDSMTQYESLRLIEEQDLQRDTVWVIDDYHLVSNPRLDDWVRFLAMNEIPRFHVILICRHTEMADLTEMSLKGYLFHIRKENLEFSETDIRNYFQHVGIILKEEETKSLQSFTEGWISGLYLSLLGYLEHGRFDLNKSILKLLKDTVFLHFSAEIQNLLLSLCMFSGFSLEQAEFISADQNAKDLLNEIVSRNGFVRFDQGNEQYQIHHLFLNFLQEEVHDRGLLGQTYARSAQWLLKNGVYSRAAEYFYLAGDFDQLYFTLEQERHGDMNEVFYQDQLGKYLDECPYEIKRKYPFALLVLALEFYGSNKQEYFGRVMQEFRVILEESENISPEYRNRLMGEYELLMSFTVYNDLTLMSVHHRKACELLKAPSDFLPRAGLWTFGSPSILYMFHREAGQLDHTIEGMMEALPAYSQATGGNAAGGEYCMKAEAYFNRGDYDNALITSYEAMNRARSQEQHTNIICVQFLQIRVDLMLGRYDELRKRADEIYQRIEKEKAYYLLPTAQMCEGYIYALTGQENQIPSWITAGDYSSDRLLFPNYAMINIIYGRTLLIRKEYHQLIGSKDRFLNMARVFPNLMGEIYTWIYLAAAYRNLLIEEPSLEALRMALDLSMEDRIYIPFVENSDYLKPLLEQIYNEVAYREVVEHILLLIKNYEVVRESGRQKKVLPVYEQLTEREKEIAILAAEGMTNQEIGDQLFISTNTVKSALKNIYGKLNINSRVLLRQYVSTLDS